MPSWSYKLMLSDVFHDEDTPFPERRDEIVRRIRRSPFFVESDYELVEITEGLGAASDLGDFDGQWDLFYDWADVNRVWVET